MKNVVKTSPNCHFQSKSRQAWKFLNCFRNENRDKNKLSRSQDSSSNNNNKSFDVTSYSNGTIDNNICSKNKSSNSNNNISSKIKNNFDVGSYGNGSVNNNINNSLGNNPRRSLLYTTTETRPSTTAE